MARATPGHDWLRRGSAFHVVKRPCGEFLIVNTQAAVEADAQDLSGSLRKFLQEQIAGSPDNEIAILTEEFRTSPRIYGYLFGETEPYDDVYREAVAALGTAMTSSSGPVRESTTPAGFTYLGQFIAHDLTRARAASKTGECESPALDLGSVYGSRDEHKAPDGRRLRTGASYGGIRYKSLDRDVFRRPDGMPMIGHPRNDDNLLLSQTHVAVVAFHNALAGQYPDWSYDEIKQKVILTLQAIALYDFLPRVADREAWMRVVIERRGYWYGDRHNGRLSDVGIPAEAAFAVLRFGHSMVRPAYEHWNGKKGDPRDVGAFVGLSYLGGGLRNFKVPGDWLPDWTAMFDMGRGEAKLKAQTIGCTLTGFLDHIPEDHLPKSDRNERNLASRTLLLGAHARLKSGFEIRDALESDGLDGFPIDAGNLVSASPAVRAVFNNRKYEELRARPPLWYYILREAEHGASQGPDGTCSRLAGVGAQLLCEIVAQAIRSACPSILAASIGDLPIGTGRPEDARMSGLVSAIGDADWYAAAGS